MGDNCQWERLSPHSSVCRDFRSPGGYLQTTHPTMAMLNHPSLGMPRPTGTVRACLSALAFLALSGMHFAAQAQGGASDCGSLARSDNFGPFDYRVTRGAELRLVESNHFTPPVEKLIKGSTDQTPGHDIDYTLRAFPNHHRALLAAVRLAEKEKKVKPHNMSFTIDCYFDRAVRWRADDVIVRMIFATYLAKTGKKVEAKAQLSQAEALAEANGFTHYNIGLVYLEMGEFDDALRQAHLAEELGFTRTNLRDGLTKAGKWADKTANSPAAGASSPAPSASNADR